MSDLNPNRVASEQRSAATAHLVDQVYAQLRAVAQQAMAGERVHHTLSATALVHEAYMRIASDRRTPWSSEAHFYTAAAEAMRRVLVDYARQRGAVKRGRGSQRVQFSDVAHLASLENPDQILALEDAFSRLEEEDPRSSNVVRLRFFAGLSLEHAADALGVSRRTAAREWAYARTRLYELLNEPDEGPSNTAGANE